MDFFQFKTIMRFLTTTTKKKERDRFDCLFIYWSDVVFSLHSLYITSSCFQHIYTIAKTISLYNKLLIFICEVVANKKFQITIRGLRDSFLILLWRWIESRAELHHCFFIIQKLVFKQFFCFLIKIEKRWIYLVNILPCTKTKITKDVSNNWTSSRKYETLK